MSNYDEVVTKNRDIQSGRHIIHAPVHYSIHEQNFPNAIPDSGPAQKSQSKTNRVMLTEDYDVHNHVMEQIALLIFQAYVKRNSEDRNVEDYDDYMHVENSVMYTKPLDAFTAGQFHLFRSVRM